MAEVGVESVQVVLWGGGGGRGCGGGVVRVVGGGGGVRVCSEHVECGVSVR